MTDHSMIRYKPLHRRGKEAYGIYTYSTMNIVLRENLVVKREIISSVAFDILNNDKKNVFYFPHIKTG